MKYILWMIMVCVLLAGTDAALAVEISIEPNPALEGEAVYLTISSDKAFTEAPDLTAWQKDFRISGQQQRQQSSFLNGVLHASYQLIYTLFPKKTGVLTLPPVSLGADQLDAGTLTVRPAGDSVDNGQPLMLLEAVVSKPRIYQGESFVYTVRLIESADITDGRIIPPAAETVSVTQTGSDRVFTEIREGQRVRVLERSFLMTPEKTGTFSIRPAEFTGYRSTGSRQPSLADLFEQGILFSGIPSQQKEVYLSAPALSVSVLPKPETWRGWWLPAAQVTLTGDFQLPQDLKAGQPFERKLVLTALGVDASRLPVPQQPAVSGLNVYPSPETRETDVLSDGQILGRVSVSVVLVPAQSGEIVVPGVTVPWFNTVLEKREEASLEAFSVSVAPAYVGSEDKTALSVEEKSPLKEQEAPAFEKTPSQEVQKTTALLIKDQWFLVGLSVFSGIVIGGFLTGLFFLLKKSRRSSKGYAPKVHARRKKKPLPDLYPF